MPLFHILNSICELVNLEGCILENSDKNTLRYFENLGTFGNFEILPYKA